MYLVYRCILCRKEKHSYNPEQSNTGVCMCMCGWVCVCVCGGRDGGKKLVASQKGIKGRY